MASTGKLGSSDSGPTANNAQSSLTAEGPDVQVARDTPTSGKVTGNDFPDETFPDKEANEALPDHNAQGGIQKMEAVTLVWTKTSLIFLLTKYVAVFALCFRFGVDA